MRQILFLIFAILTLAGFSGCASYDTRLASRETQYLMGPATSQSAISRQGYDGVSYWDGDGVSGPPSVQIHLEQQKAYFYKGDQLVGVSQVSSGREGYDTPAGSYKFIQKNKDHVSNLYGSFVDAVGNVLVRDASSRDPKPPGAIFKGAPMPYFMRIVGGVGMHAGFLPGYPASHGCIRMPEKMAEIFFANITVGTPVSIYR
ncbi:MAG TPA: L,D-transpeptidase family protein [Chthoniobacterales bacterium]